MNNKVNPVNVEDAPPAHPPAVVYVYGLAPDEQSTPTSSVVCAKKKRSKLQVGVDVFKQSCGLFFACMACMTCACCCLCCGKCVHDEYDDDDDEDSNDG